MALLFSKVTMTGDGYETEFLVGGIPREYEDLEGWCAADDFLEDLLIFRYTQKRTYTEKEKRCGQPQRRLLTS